MALLIASHSLWVSQFSWKVLLFFAVFATHYYAAGSAICPLAESYVDYWIFGLTAKFDANFSRFR